MSAIGNQGGLHAWRRQRAFAVGKARSREPR